MTDAEIPLYVNAENLLIDEETATFMFKTGHDIKAIITRNSVTMIEKANGEEKEGEVTGRGNLRWM